MKYSIVTTIICMYNTHVAYLCSIQKLTFNKNELLTYGCAFIIGSHMKNK